MNGIILLGYIVGVFVLAWWSGRSGTAQSSDHSAEEQYLAGKSLTPLESLCSIIATEVSALTFLGIPALAFDTNFSFVQIYIGAIVGRVIIALVFLPKVYDSGLTVYEVMARDLGLPSGQRTVAVMYSLSKVLSVGVRLFSGCILVSAFLGISIYTGIILVTGLTFLYTLIGGLKAGSDRHCANGTLCWRGIAAHLLIPDVNGQEWGAMMETAANMGKTTIVGLEQSTALHLWFTRRFPLRYGNTRRRSGLCTTSNSRKKSQTRTMGDLSVVVSLDSHGTFVSQRGCTVVCLPSIDSSTGRFQQ